MTEQFEDVLRRLEHREGAIGPFAEQSDLVFWLWQQCVLQTRETNGSLAAKVAEVHHTGNRQREYSLPEEADKAWRKLQRCLDPESTNKQYLVADVMLSIIQALPDPYRQIARIRLLRHAPRPALDDTADLKTALLAGMEADQKTDLARFLMNDPDFCENATPDQWAALRIEFAEEKRCLGELEKIAARREAQAAQKLRAVK